MFKYLEVIFKVVGGSCMRYVVWGKREFAFFVEVFILCFCSILVVLCIGSFVFAQCMPSINLAHQSSYDC